MKLALRRKSKTERAIDATSDLAKLWAGAKLTKGTARAGRKAAKLKAVGGTGRRAAIGKAVVGSRTGRRAAIGKAVASSQTGRDAGRKALGAALAGKAVKGAAKRRSGESRRGRKLLVLGGAAGAVVIALKARKGRSDDQAPTWTPPDVPVGGATVGGGTAPGPMAPAPTGGAPTDAADPATPQEDGPNGGATGLTPEAVQEQASRR